MALGVGGDGITGRTGLLGAWRSDRRCGRDALSRGRRVRVGTESAQHPQAHSSTCSLPCTTSFSRGIIVPPFKIDPILFDAQRCQLQRLVGSRGSLGIYWLVLPVVL